MKGYFLKPNTKPNASNVLLKQNAGLSGMQQEKGVLTKKMKKGSYFLLFLFLVITSYAYTYASSHSLLVHKSSMIYLGSFRVPREGLGILQYSTLSYGGAPIAYDSEKNGLFIFGHPYGKLLAEISVPEPINSSDVNDLPTATVLQQAVSVTNNWNALRPGGENIVGSNGIPGGLLLFGDKLIGTAYVYYDASGHNGYRSHYVISSNWTQEGIDFKGFYHIGEKGDYNGGKVGGYMALIPPEWRYEFGALLLRV